VIVVSSGQATYCLRSTHNGDAVYKDGPSGEITETACT